MKLSALSPKQLVEIEACTRCGRYLKTLTVLQGAAPADVLLEDLATVELDIAALAREYRRPADTGYPLTIAFTTLSKTA